MLHVVIIVAEPAEREVELSKFESDMEFAGNNLMFVTVRNMADRGKGQFRIYSGYVQGFQLLAQYEGLTSRAPEGEVLIAKYPEGVTDNGRIKIMRIDFGQLNDQ
ncbi:hypothetical protein PoB_002086700 [Plakobranchus ocellatus]|uniref:Uncharacterized protein n=1 Tax=Plakobranchus ocellatus TaxID=259542 RepID=A0AAV3ZIK6_9GAST|nr:hypothetical protein PoB_002086700 [Plakobranchus ocellatus]